MFPKNKHIVCLLFLFLGRIGLFAQDLIPADFQNSTATSPIFTTGKANSVYLTQVGTGNTANVNQTGNTLATRSNLVRVFQSGQLNLAQANQVGQNNRTDILQQNGNANKVVSNIQGNDNTNLFIQNGNLNLIEQNLVNSHLNQSNFTQNGDNNVIQQTLTNKTGQNLNVTQNGNGLRLVINQSN